MLGETRSGLICPYRCEVRMKLSLKLIPIVLVLAGLLAGCGRPTPQEAVLPTLTVATGLPSLAPSPLPSSPTPAPTRPAPSATPSPSPLPPTPTAPKVDLNLATLSLKELPVGFQALDEKSQAQAGLSPDAIRQSFAGIFKQAEPIHSFAFVTSDPKNFEIVVGLVFAPVVPAEQGSFDQILVDPNGAIKNFAKSFGGEAKALANLPNLGDSRTAWGFTTTSGQPPLKGEMILLRRDTIVALLLTLFPSDKNPPAPAVNLAQTLDGNLKKALGK
jgi:hypothetical protein